LSGAPKGRVGKNPGFFEKTQPKWVFSGFIGFFRVLSGFFGFYWVLSGFFSFKLTKSLISHFFLLYDILCRVAPDIRLAGYPAFFGIRYPAGYPAKETGYPVGRIAGYPARKLFLIKNRKQIKKKNYKIFFSIFKNHRY